MEIERYLENLELQLVDSGNWQTIFLTRQWTSSVPNKPGVYVIKERGIIVYVGESGNLRGRMKDLLDSRHHTVRRTIGRKLFSDIEDFTMATSRAKFPEHIEQSLNDHICKNLTIAYLEVQLGRKELEERIQSLIPEELKLNIRGRRKTG
jgi:hypothetical protein